MTRDFTSAFSCFWSSATGTTAAAGGSSSALFAFVADFEMYNLTPSLSKSGRARPPGEASPKEYW